VKPINLNPLLTVWLATAPAVSRALEDGDVTVNEAIDIAATAAKACAKAKGISNTVIATIKEPEAE